MCALLDAKVHYAYLRARAGKWSWSILAQGARLGASLGVPLGWPPRVGGVTYVAPRQ
eukprot:CAMPEP_0183342224 /NCGR_PEP_ID=MMETSP0164_2-20130417/8372_1 /TAXON_ID=221442 /ORGANISM="Coccolithus pelagicus ssp braarudi, Strain PLY182g" /LENGTH=56 /DNA_ID=CAMNT_0025512743 /DNA_START=30 /DNA_END=200 /DNA_ORIENTATION=+